MELNTTEVSTDTTEQDTTVDDGGYAYWQLHTDSEEYLVKDEKLLQHEYITNYVLVPSGTDFYYLACKAYNLGLSFFWLVLGIFVFRTVFMGLKHFYTKS